MKEGKTKVQKEEIKDGWMEGRRGRGKEESERKKEGMKQEHMNEQDTGRTGKRRVDRGGRGNGRK